MDELNPPTKDLRDLIAGLRRRLKPIAIISSALIVVSTLTAFLLPPVYESKATILIEEQEIPASLVQSTITTFAWQRVQTISQRVMTRANLLDIVERFDLFKQERRRKTSEEIIGMMRDNIKLEPISADVVDSRAGRAMTRGRTVAICGR